MCVCESVDSAFINIYSTCPYGLALGAVFSFICSLHHINSWAYMSSLYTCHFTHHRMSLGRFLSQRVRAGFIPLYILFFKKRKKKSTGAMALCILVSKVCGSVYQRWNVCFKRNKQTYKCMYTYKDPWKCVNNDKKIMGQNNGLEAGDMCLAGWLQRSLMPFSALEQGWLSFSFWGFSAVNKVFYNA